MARSKPCRMSGAALGRTSGAQTTTLRNHFSVSALALAANDMARTSSSWARIARLRPVVRSGINRGHTWALPDGHRATPGIRMTLPRQGLGGLLRAPRKKQLLSTAAGADTAHRLVLPAAAWPMMASSSAPNRWDSTISISATGGSLSLGPSFSHKRDRSCCCPLFCDLLGHFMQESGDLFDVVGRYLRRSERVERLRHDRAQHVDRLLECRDVIAFR